MAKPPGDNQYAKVDRVLNGPEAPIPLGASGIDKHLADKARKFAARLDEISHFVVTLRNLVQTSARLLVMHFSSVGSTFISPTTIAPDFIPVGLVACIFH